MLVLALALALALNLEANSQGCLCSNPVIDPRRNSPFPICPAWLARENIPRIVLPNPPHWSCLRPRVVNHRWDIIAPKGKEIMTSDVSNHRNYP